MPLQDISNVSPWSQITAQFNLFNSGSDSTPSASTAGRRLLQTNSSFADFAPQDTIMSDLTKEGLACHFKTARTFAVPRAWVLQYAVYSTVLTSHGLGVVSGCHRSAEHVESVRYLKCHRAKSCKMLLLLQDFPQNFNPRHHTCGVCTCRAHPYRSRKHLQLLD